MCWHCNDIADIVWQYDMLFLLFSTSDAIVIVTSVFKMAVFLHKLVYLWWWMWPRLWPLISQLLISVTEDSIVLHIHWFVSFIELQKCVDLYLEFTVILKFIVCVMTVSYIKCKKLTSLQHRVRATNSHIQNSKNHFTRPSW